MASIVFAAALAGFATAAPAGTLVQRGHGNPFSSCVGDVHNRCRQIISDCNKTFETCPKDNGKIDYRYMEPSLVAIHAAIAAAVQVNVEIDVSVEECSQIWLAFYTDITVFYKACLSVVVDSQLDTCHNTILQADDSTQAWLTSVSHVDEQVQTQIVVIIQQDTTVVTNIRDCALDHSRRTYHINSFNSNVHETIHGGYHWRQGGQQWGGQQWGGQQWGHQQQGHGHQGGHSTQQGHEQEGGRQHGGNQGGHEQDGGRQQGGNQGGHEQDGGRQQGGNQGGHEQQGGNSQPGHSQQGERQQGGQGGPGRHN